MVIKYDKENDSVYIKLQDAIVAESEENKPGIILDYDDNGNVVGIEVLNASEKSISPDNIVYEVA